MRFYLILTLLAGTMFGGYRLSETYRRLESFHRQFLDAGPNADHVVITPQGVSR